MIADNWALVPGDPTRFVTDPQKIPAAQGEKDLEPLKSGKATINNLRKEAGLSPIEGGDELLVKPFNGPMTS